MSRTHGTHAAHRTPCRTRPPHSHAMRRPTGAVPCELVIRTESIQDHLQRSVRSAARRARPDERHRPDNGGKSPAPPPPPPPPRAVVWHSIARHGTAWQSAAAGTSETPSQPADGRSADVRLEMHGVRGSRRMRSYTSSRSTTYGRMRRASWRAGLPRTRARGNASPPLPTLMLLHARGCVLGVARCAACLALCVLCAAAAAAGTADHPQRSTRSRAHTHGTSTHAGRGGARRTPPPFRPPPAASLPREWPSARPLRRSGKLRCALG